MEIPVTLRFFLTAKSPQAKQKVWTWITSHLAANAPRLTIPDIESGDGALTHAGSWADGIFQLLRICQSIGHQWVLTDNIDFRFDAWSNQPAIAGVEAINVIADNPDVTREDPDVC